MENKFIEITTISNGKVYINIDSISYVDNCLDSGCKIITTTKEELSIKESYLNIVKMITKIQEQ